MDVEEIVRKVTGAGVVFVQSNHVEMVFPEEGFSSSFLVKCEKKCFSCIYL